MFEQIPSARASSWLALGATFLALTISTPLCAYEAIENHEDRPNPWIINGCTIKEKTSCPGADLRFEDLRGANLNGANLEGAKLDRTDLRYADLRGANLKGADFGGADLRYVFMQGAKAAKASFVGANMEMSRIGGADLSGADFTVANMEMAQARRAKFVGARFVNTDMQEAKFQETNLTDALMDKPKLRFINFENAWMQGCKGCPSHWQTDKPVWETFPLEKAPSYPDQSPPKTP